jgi:hypothetical protein
MKTNHNKTDKTGNRVALVILITGLMLLAYMVVVESEPGALPLLMILLGGGWYGYLWIRHRQNERKPCD